MGTRWLFVLACGCSFERGTVVDDATPGDHATLVDDTAAEFAVADLIDGATIDPRGAIEPMAYALNGFEARAYDGKLVAGTTASWTEIEQAAAGATLRGAAYQQLPPDAGWAGEHPTGLGLTGTSDNFTVIYEGEVRVAAGDHTIDLDADDAGALEIDTGGGFEGFIVDANPGPKQIQFHVDEDRWIGVRTAIGEGSGNARLQLHVDGAALTPDMVRARVTDERGFVASVYVPANGALALAGMARVDSPNVSFGTLAPPYDLTPSTTYTVRFTGQLRIDSAGMYTLAATPDAKDSAAIYVDRHLVAHQAAVPGFPTTATLQLSAGWHMIDIELGASQVNFFGQPDPRDITLAVTLGQGDDTPVALDATNVRPAVASGYLALATTPEQQLADADPNGGVTELTFGDLAPSFSPGTVESELVGFGLRNGTFTDYTVVFDTGAGQRAIPSTAVLAAVFGDETAAGQPLPGAGAWKLRFTDGVAGNGSDPTGAGFAYVTLHGGPLVPFAPELTYVSAPRTLDGVKQLGELRVLGDLAGASLAISVRAAASADELEAAPWVDVENGTIPVVDAAPVIQYRLVVSGDGWSYPSIDRVELDYTR